MKPVQGALVVLTLALIISGCSSTPTAGRGAPGQGSSVVSRISPDEARDVTVYAVGLVGTPYRYGGNTPDSGFDCSGLIGHVYKTRAGLALPRSVAGLQYWGQPVDASGLRSGDLVIFGRGSSAPTHAGIYVGGGRFVHAPSSGGTVRLELLTAKHWAAQRIEYRRP